MSFNPAFEPLISTARLDTYRRLTGGDDQRAWQLYRWNVHVSAAFLPMLGDIEVALRNTIHVQLSSRFGREDWWASNQLILDDVTVETLTDVVSRHQKKITKGTVGVGKVIGELMLGTWVMLLSKGGTSSLGRAVDYEANLWRPAIRLGFATGEVTRSGRPRRPTRDEVHDAASLMQRLRNRCAHHEPIVQGVRPSGTTSLVPLAEVWSTGLQLLAWMSHELAELHRADVTVTTLLAERPA